MAKDDSVSRRIEIYLRENPSVQRYLREVETYLTKGWEYVAALPTGKAVLKLPN